MPSEVQTKTLNVRRQDQVIERDESRVICRPLLHGGDPTRIKNIVQRIFQLNEQQTEQMLEQVLNNFISHHKNIRKIFDHHFQKVQSFLPAIQHSSISESRKQLIGAYFTMEYAIESAALFNPSIVLHPDQTGVDEGCKRFVMSFRAVGEGHISSLVFRSGIIEKNGDLSFDPESPYANTPVQLNPDYDRHLFQLKLDEMGENDDVAIHILSRLPETFNLDDLKEEVNYLSENPLFDKDRQMRCFHNMLRLADSNYEVEFPENSEISERVLFPVSEEESGGIEDARFVKFKEDDGKTTYYGIYTAYDGNSILPQMIETRDFRRFRVRTLNGKAVRNKGMALFPRKIKGKYVMLSRQDGENNHIMFSDEINFWQQSKIIQRPRKYWEYIQLGNCGSPLETSEGWLVLTHGVGPVRTYSIGAILLDLENPARLIGHLEEPLLRAEEHERSGYVPNVVYTCGAIIHHDRLIIPYAVADTQPALASVAVDDLIEAMNRV
ncbi:MAG TPA: glycoside hydrolase family 130 protein [Balneolaceae bacterium]|nr:glycoside hydrolase family 130 protein [Balneolaceae bacterium]